MIDAARDMIVEAMGASIRRRLGAAVATNWQRNPRFRGGHSYRLPGDPDARLRLDTPLRGRIFFAGEATSSESWATAHGAYESGIRAAREIATKLAPPPRRIRSARKRA